MLETAGSTTYEQLTLSVAGSRASLIPSPGSNEARRMTVTSGRKCAVLLTNSSPLGSFVRMCLESSSLSSMACYLTWKPWATTRFRLGFRLVPWTRRSQESGYSLWPSPNRSDARRCKFSLAVLAGEIEARHKRGVGMFFTEAVAADFGGYPTPEFVEWLMGFPVGWTDLGHSETP